jgi:hypothetical protein
VFPVRHEYYLYIPVKGSGGQWSCESSRLSQFLHNWLTNGVQMWKGVESTKLLALPLNFQRALHF